LEIPISKLFTPFRLRDVTTRNRVWVAPMCQYSAEDGVPNEWHRVHLGTRASGGAGLVLTEATAVAPEGRITPWCTGLWNDNQVDAFRPITEFVRGQGAVPGIQLAHAGRKASTGRPWEGGGLIPPERGGWQPVGPSPLAFDAGFATPHELSATEIDALVDAWAAAADRALVAGFDVVELHFAHGYLAHEFLSPVSNQRQDEYGGSLENRARFALRITRAVRAVWPAHLPLLVRISATEYVDGGWDLEDSIVLSEWLRDEGVDLIDCSSGGNSPLQTLTPFTGYQVPFAAAIRSRVGIATGAVGLITDPEQAEGILERGDADVVLLARELLRNPYWPLHAAAALGDRLDYWPKQYLRAAVYPE
jgi:2,4-dienoyl-CoA reductase-like NADH-dependent reductase (Old Yellow Enzyme family)